MDNNYTYVHGSLNLVVDSDNFMDEDELCVIAQMWHCSVSFLLYWRTGRGTTLG